jgi:hypothetical protein
MESSPIGKHFARGGALLKLSLGLFSLEHETIQDFVGSGEM